MLFSSFVCFTQFRLQTTVAKVSGSISHSLRVIYRLMFVTHSCSLVYTTIPRRDGHYISAFYFVSYGWLHCLIEYSLPVRHIGDSTEWLKTFLLKRERRFCPHGFYATDSSVTASLLFVTVSFRYLITAIKNFQLV